MTRWLLAGALPAETLPLLRRLQSPRLLGHRLVAGRLAGREVAILTTGVGPRHAARRTAAALERWEADRLLSLGTCGALIEGLPDGTVVTGALLGEEGGARRAAAPLPGLPAVAIATVSRVVTERDRRARLAAAGFSVCEMEAFSVAGAARGRPVHALKVVSDQAGAEARPTFGGSPFPSPARLVRFQLHAYHLVETRLVPALLRVVVEPVSSL